MSISKRITEAIDKMAVGVTESALISASIAVDATASQVYPAKRNNQAYKDWLHDNLPLITIVGMGNVSIENMHLAYSHCDLQPDDKGRCLIEQIIYHVVRCGLLHKAKLPNTLKFSSEGVIKIEGDTLTLGSSLIKGLIMAVVVCEVNAKERTLDNYGIAVFDKSLSLNELWGKKEVLLNLFEADDAT